MGTNVRATLLATSRQAAFLTRGEGGGEAQHAVRGGETLFVKSLDYYYVISCNTENLLLLKPWIEICTYLKANSFASKITRILHATYRISAVETVDGYDT